MRNKIVFIGSLFVFGFLFAACSPIIPEIVNVTGVSIEEGDQGLEEDEIIQLTAVIVPADAENQAVNWSSDNIDVATVDENGLVTAIAEGEANITVTTDDGNFANTVKVTVITAEDPCPTTCPPVPVAVTGISMDKVTMISTVGETETLLATIEPENATNKNIIWSSSDTNIATVSNGEITLLEEGEATITARTADGGFTAECELTVTYFVFDSSTKTITGYNIAGGLDVDIPPQIGGIEVEHIGNYPFYNMGLKSVIIPDSVKTIGTGAFYENELTAIVIPDSVTSISSSAFRDNDLEEVDIPNSVTSLGGHVFRNNALTSISIPDSLEGIGEHAFSYNNLTSVDIPNSVKAIGMSAFRDNDLAEVIFGDSVVNIYHYSFANNDLASITIPNSVEYIGSFAFAYNDLASITIPNSVKSIDSSAFRDNELTSVDIPNSVTSLGGSAFQFNKLTSVTIPDSLTSISISTFRNNELTSINIPDSVEYIGRFAFANNDLTSITTPDSVETIDGYAFYENYLVRVEIGADVDIASEVTTMGQNTGFKNVYDGGDREEGIYVYDADEWKKE